MRSAPARATGSARTTAAPDGPARTGSDQPADGLRTWTGSGPERLGPARADPELSAPGGRRRTGAARPPLKPGPAR